ncbi:MAG: hypothetical protein ABSE73_18905 [Planctomycetota bacterium]
MKHNAIIWLALAACAAGTACAAGRGHKPNKDQGPDLDWHDTLEDALDWSKENKDKPVMLVLYHARAAGKSRAGDGAHAAPTATDAAQIAKLGSWPILVQASSDHFAAVKGSPKNLQIRALAKAAAVKTLPFIVWLDQYGNPVKAQPIPDSAAPLADTARNWPTLIANVEKFLKETTARGEKYLAQGHLREAYLELTPLAPFKGPLAEKAQQDRDKVKEAWRNLALASNTSAPDSRERKVVMDGLLQEIQGTDCEHQIKQLIAVADQSAPAAEPAKNAPATEPPPAAAADAKPPAAVAQPAKPAAAADAKPPAAAAEPAKPAAPAPPEKDEASDELDTTGHGKALADLAAMPSTPAPAAPGASALQSGFLNDSAEPRLKEAARLIQEGSAAYKQALADNMDRGPARNKLLKSAYSNLDKASLILQEFVAQKPDAKLDSLLQQMSMMMYGCIKYQSL